MITDADEDILKTVVPDLLYSNERESDKELFCVIMSPLASTNVLPWHDLLVVPLFKMSETCWSFSFELLL